MYNPKYNQMSMKALIRWASSGDKEAKAELVRRNPKYRGMSVDCLKMLGLGIDRPNRLDRYQRKAFKFGRNEPVDIVMLVADYWRKYQ